MKITLPETAGHSGPIHSTSEQDQLESAGEISAIEAAVWRFEAEIWQQLGAEIKPIPDGSMHTFRDPETEGFNQHGWYCFHESGTAAVFGTTRCEGVKHWNTDLFDKLSETEKSVINERLHEAKELKTNGGNSKNEIASGHKQVSSERATLAPSVSEQSRSATDQPIPLKSELPPVKPFVENMLPEALRGFVRDTAERLQIPLDYLAISTIAISTGVVGSKYGIHPKQQDDWLVIPTMWASLVGPPSALKSPALSEAKRPLDELERELAKEYEIAKTFYRLKSDVADDAVKQATEAAKKVFAKDEKKALQMILDAELDEKEPNRTRIMINDATVESCGAIMSENPNGLLLFRDELSGFITKISREDFQSDRAFYLEAFNGNSRFTTHRIGRGTIEIESCTLSICGGIQPSKIAPLIRGAVDGVADDGFVQRFQLTTWPDQIERWEWVDRKPDKEAYDSYRSAIRRLHNLPRPGSDKHPGHLRYSADAQRLFRCWMEDLQNKIRSSDIHPIMQSHLAKMPKTIAGLALLFELIEGGQTAVGEEATQRALLWADYLESHAARLYSLASDRALEAARTIVSRRNKLPIRFTARDVQRKSWAGLSTVQDVADALECLIEHSYITEIPVSPTNVGGRPKMLYRWHPSLTKES